MTSVTKIDNFPAVEGLDYDLPLISLDIETDTSPLTEQEIAAGYTARGLDPAITPITAVVLYTNRTAIVMHQGTERAILVNLAELIKSFDPSTIITWNGSVFDLPFLKSRANLLGLDHLYEDLILTLDPTIIPKYAPTPGHEGGYTATWGAHKHRDIAYEYKDRAALDGVSWSLKPVAEAVLGYKPISVDRENMHTLTEDELLEYVASDGVITYELAALLN